MNPFDQAWALVKAPFVPYNEIGGYEEPFSDVLYSGGDTSDSPEYWSKNPQDALAYALFGSAVPMKGYEHLFSRSPDYDEGHKPPLRETVPTIRMSRDDPEWETMLRVDPESDAYISEMNEDITTEHMSDDVVEQMINEAIKNPSFIPYMSRYATTARHHSEDERLKHMIEAKKRLLSGESGNIDIDDEAPYKSIMSFGMSDNMDLWVDEDPEYLDTWQLIQLIKTGNAFKEHYEEFSDRTNNPKR